MITLHVILALTIVFNPLNQELEEFLNVPHGLKLLTFLFFDYFFFICFIIIKDIIHFFYIKINFFLEISLQRILLRGVMMIAVVIVAETIPNFGVLLDLVGGSTITLMALIFPALFNLYLCAARKKYGPILAEQNEKSVTIAE